MCRSTLLAHVGLLVCATVSRPLGAAQSDPGPATPASADIAWHTDYAEAMKVARAEQKMMFLFFHADGQNAIRQRFETASLADPTVRKLLEGYVAVKLPVDVRIVVGGAEIEVLKHAAFAEMGGQEGLAIIDFAHPGSEQYGHVVSAFTFTQGKYYEYHPEHLAVILDLPAGTITQRTLVFAVRIHPETPASTTGQIDPVLVTEAKRHSGYQARIRRQGHHHWESRFHRISRLLPGGLRAQEVCAESWPHEGLVDAAVDCVDSWRHSAGHWSAVRARQLRFGYDMKRGSNGIWYATGIFGNRR